MTGLPYVFLGEISELNDAGQKVVVLLVRIPETDRFMLAGGVSDTQVLIPTSREVARHALSADGSLVGPNEEFDRAVETARSLGLFEVVPIGQSDAG